MRLPANGDPHIEVRGFKPARVVRHSALSVDQSLSLVCYYTMEVTRQASIPTLDKDTSRRLVSFLRVREVIQMSQVCKAFWEISCGTSTLYCSLSFSQAPQEADASLMRFIRSRCQQGMEVRNAGHNDVRWLGLCMHACQSMIGVVFTAKSYLSRLTPGSCIPGGNAAPCVVGSPAASYVGQICCGLVQGDAASPGA